jgi:transposase
MSIPLDRVPNAALSAANSELAETNARLLALLDESRRGGKRQAAPFSKGDPAAEPKRPGRKKGLGYGKRAARPVPEHPDRELDTPLPAGGCRHCGGEVTTDGFRDQFVCEVPTATPQVTRFRVHVGRCQSCRRRVHGRHPEQHSDALGAAGVQLGPRALGIAHLLHYRYGLSFARAAAVLSEMFGLPVSRAAICRAWLVERTSEAVVVAIIIGTTQPGLAIGLAKGPCFIDACVDRDGPW